MKSSVFEATVRLEAKGTIVAARTILYWLDFEVCFRPAAMVLLA